MSTTRSCAFNRICVVKNRRKQRKQSGIICFLVSLLSAASCSFALFRLRESGRWFLPGLTMIGDEEINENKAGGKCQADPKPAPVRSTNAITCFEPPPATEIAD